MVVVSVVFMLILSPELGLVNPLLRQIGLGSLERAWLGDPGTALYTVITVDVWKNFGFAMFLFVAGLKSIDAELYEASRIDGAAPGSRSGVSRCRSYGRSQRSSSSWSASTPSSSSI